MTYVKCSCCGYFDTYERMSAHEAECIVITIIIIITGII